MSRLDLPRGMRAYAKAAALHHRLMLIAGQAPLVNPARSSGASNANAVDAVAVVVSIAIIINYTSVTIIMTTSNVTR